MNRKSSDRITEITENSSSSFDEAKVFRYFFHTMLGIDYLHYKNIIHKDIKPENLLIDQYDNVRIADFGCSAVLVAENLKTKYNGTLPYMAPELIKKQPYGKEVDIWSCGVLLFKQFHGVFPFDISNKGNLKESIINLDNEYIYFRKGVTNDVKEIISKMLEPDVKKRAVLDEIFYSAWMKNNYKIFNIDVEFEMNKKLELETRDPVSIDLKNEDQILEQSNNLMMHSKTLSIDSLNIQESTYNKLYKTGSDWSLKESETNQNIQLINITKDTDVEESPKMKIKPKLQEKKMIISSSKDKKITFSERFKIANIFCGCISRKKHK